MGAGQCGSFIIEKQLGPAIGDAITRVNLISALKKERMPELVLMRHGATVWGGENRFAGWGDTPLSEAGKAESLAAARALAQLQPVFDQVFTSRLLRARQTHDILSQHLSNSGSILIQDWRLNERHYGALQEHSRADMIALYGNAQVVAWRRSYDAVPPPLPLDDPRWHEQLQRFPDVEPQLQPRAESIAMAAQRAGAVWHETLAPRLRAGESLLVVAHTSSLRGLSKIIHGLDDTAAAEFRIATAIPRLYHFSDTLELVDHIDIQSGARSQVRTWLNRFKPKRWGFA
jgi:2,3-bisphosphoglycerate-dependent phosphoglycerate mutase